MQLQLLEGREMIPKVDAHDVGVIGHSFGGSLTLPMAERKPDLWAVVIFSGAGYRWDRSPELRARLLTAVENIAMAVLLIHASNDYSSHRARRWTRNCSNLVNHPPIGSVTPVRVRVLRHHRSEHAWHDVAEFWLQPKAVFPGIGEPLAAIKNKIAKSWLLSRFPPSLYRSLAFSR